MDGTRHVVVVLAARIIVPDGSAPDDELRGIELNVLRRDLIEPKIAECYGSIAPSVGENFVAHFPHATAAATCAAALQRLMRVYSGAGGPKGGFGLGMAVHLGPATSRDDVERVAVRLRAMGAPGELLVSDAVREDVRSTTAMEFEALAIWLIPGLADRIGVWRCWPERRATAAGANKARGEEPRPRPVDRSLGSGPMARLAALVPMSIAFTLAVAPHEQPGGADDRSLLFDSRSRSVMATGEAGAVLAGLEPRSGSYFQVDDDPSRVTLAVSFVAKRSSLEQIEPSGLGLAITGLSNDRWPAWRTEVALRPEDDWKRFSISDAPGVNAVVGAAPDSAGSDVLPFALVIECLATFEMLAWTGQVAIEISERQTGRILQTYALQMPMPAQIPPDASCP